MTLKYVCVVCVCLIFSAHFFLSIPDKIFSSPCTMCVFDSTFASSSSLSSVSISIFVCFESVSGCLSLNILCYYKCLHIARVHRFRRYYHFFLTATPLPTLALHSNSHSLSFSSSFPVCVLFSYATAVLCFATTM